jgi:outer membrane lipoprotein SlyB
MENRMKKQVLIALGAALATAAVSGCQAPSQGARTYRAGQAQRAMQSYPGIILRAEQVQIQHDESGGGSVAGAVLGGVVGSTIGGGRGQRLATAGGAAAGSAMGSAAERSRNLRPAWELEVELEDGRIMVIVQENDDDYAAGDHVRVIEAGDGTLRVRQ